MRYKIYSFITILAVFASIAYIHGAEHFGVRIYPGAWMDKEETKFIREKGGADSYIYRTNDSVKKVAAFYEKQPGITSLGSNEKGGMFIKEQTGHTVYLKVESPWQPSKGGELKNDTLIVISLE